jgi:NAD(P)H dehydrogenase (quinone)
MAKALVLYYLSHGKVEKLVHKIAAGAREAGAGAPYGATTIAGPDAQRRPNENELAGAWYHGRAIAETATKLHG